MVFCHVGQQHKIQASGRVTRSRFEAEMICRAPIGRRAASRGRIGRAEAVSMRAPQSLQSLQMLACVFCAGSGSGLRMRVRGSAPHTDVGAGRPERVPARCGWTGNYFLVGPSARGPKTSSRDHRNSSSVANNQQRPLRVGAVPDRHNAPLRARPSLDKAPKGRRRRQGALGRQQRLGHLCTVPSEQSIFQPE